jgi:RNA polymerase sigma-70 factor (ECF subfamily)
MRTPASIPLSELTDDELFAEIQRLRTAGEDFRTPLGVLCERWREPSYAVVRKLQGSFMRGSPDDQQEVFQEAVGKLIARGLAQFRGISEHTPGAVASPRSFFLRIVKHVAIDRYRHLREELARERDDGEDAPTESVHEVARAVKVSQAKEQGAEAREEYWMIFARLQREHPKEASAWDLYHHQDVDDHGECARQLGITVVNSYKRVSRAQAYMKLYLLELRREEES